MRCVLAVMVLEMLLCGVARGALQFDVFPGYEGVMRTACWVPMVFEIKNDGPSFKGVIELVSDPYRRGQTMRLAVELPTGTLKRVVMPAFVGERYGSTWDVYLRDERGRVRAEQTSLRARRQVGHETLVVASLPRSVSGVVLFPADWGGREETRPASVRMLPAIFPDHPIVLQGLDAVYLNSDVAGTLNPGQVAALLAWMRGGGHLVVALEQVSDVTALPWLQEILPCQPRELRIVKAHPELHRWVVGATDGAGGFGALASDAAFEQAELPVLAGPVRGAKVLVQAGEIPLVVGARRGAGRVSVLLFSPEREPVRSWKLLPYFWARLLGPVGSGSGAGLAQASVERTDGIFGAMIDTRQVRKLPVTALLALLGVYLVVIGPLDRWWLRRIGRPMLTWITFPSYVVGFSLLIYFLGHRLRSGETESNEFTLVDVLAQGERAEWRGRTYASIYSPRNEWFTLQSGERFASLRGEMGAGGWETGSDRARVWMRGNSFTAEVLVPVWTSQLFVCDWWRRAAAPLEAEVQSEGAEWRVVVRNSTAGPLRDLHLVAADRVIPLGELEAGQQRVFRVAKLSGMSLQDVVSHQRPIFQSAIWERRQAFGSARVGRVGDRVRAGIAMSFISYRAEAGRPVFAPPPGLDLSAVIEQGGAVLLAWSVGEPSWPPLNQTRVVRSRRDTLWRVPIEIRETQ